MRKIDNSGESVISVIELFPSMGRSVTTDQNPEGAELKEAGTLASSVRRKLAQRILDGEFEAESRLDEKVLASQYEVSRTPVREAFAQLAAIGLVEMRPRKGVFVLAIDETRIDEAFEASAEFEGVCTFYAARRGDFRERKKLWRTLGCGLEAISADDPIAFADANRKLHSQIAAMSKNASIERLSKAASLEAAPFQRSHYSRDGEMERSQKEHQAIVDAIIMGNDSEARELMRRHILRIGAEVASQDYPRN